MTTVEKKIKNGKLLRVEFEKKDDRITKIKITGDFFIYPEESIEKIEKIIISTKQPKLTEELNKFIDSNNIHIVGFAVENLVESLKITQYTP